MTDIKQVIVMRTDLSMRKGKMCAQAAHASMAFLTEGMHNTLGEIQRPSGTLWITELTEVEELWIKDSFTKICVGVG